MARLYVAPATYLARGSEAAPFESLLHERLPTAQVRASALTIPTKGVPPLEPGFSRAKPRLVQGRAALNIPAQGMPSLDATRALSQQRNISAARKTPRVAQSMRVSNP